MSIWIKSQDKETLGCYLQIYIDNNITNDISYKIEGENDSTYSVLGCYSSIERCKQILNDIEYAIITGKKTFEMPEN